MPAYHVIWVTHNTRLSERMITFNVRMGEPVLMTPDMEIEVAESVLRSVRHNRLCVLAYNSCEHHIHMILVCHRKRRDAVVGRLKTEATQRYKSRHNIADEYHLWGQKYPHRLIDNEQYLWNCMRYIRKNREWHNLQPIPDLQSIVDRMITPIEKVRQWWGPAFAPSPRAAGDGGM